MDVYNKLKDRVIGKILELINDDNVGTIKNIIDVINNRNEYRCKIRKLSIKPLRYD